MQDTAGAKAGPEHGRSHLIIFKYSSVSIFELVKEFKSIIIRSDGCQSSVMMLGPFVCMMCSVRLCRAEPLNVI